MKAFRDMFTAVLIGLIGGLFVTTIAYYNNHKDGGMLQTLFAVSNSFEKVAKAYSNVNGDNLLGGDDYNLQDEVLEAFHRIEEGEEEPYTGILRFHVRANSDSKEDQELKMAVKEDVITMLKPLIADCKNSDETKSVIVSNLNNIYKTAMNTIEEQGYDYNVRVYVTKEEFPAKTYGGLTFPAGSYQALRVDIGNAKGQNWWCVMFPPLCFIDESTAVVSEKSKGELKEVLTPEEYAALFAYSKDGRLPDGRTVEIKGESVIYNWVREKLGFDD